MGIPPEDQTRPSGAQMAEVSNAVVAVFTECYGRGPTKAKSFLVDDYLITVLEDFLTTVEHTLVERGKQDLVREVRLTFQDEMSDHFKHAVEEVLGRRVVAYHSQVVFNPSLGFEIFVLEPEAEAATE
jgi:uncharacterized protein YbcI